MLFHKDFDVDRLIKSIQITIIITMVIAALWIGLPFAWFLSPTTTIIACVWAVAALLASQIDWYWVKLKLKEWKEEL